MTAFPRLRLALAATATAAVVAAAAATAATTGPASSAMRGRNISATTGPAPKVYPSSSPAFGMDAPDPDVIRVGSTYYAYTTGTTWGNHIGVLTSTSPSGGFHTITGHPYGSTALGPLPAWEKSDTQTSPGVFFWGGRYMMYYDALDMTTGLTCITVATSTNPAGPFRDTSSAPFLCQRTYAGSVDPSPFIDANGQPWLYWKSNDGSSALPAYLWGAPLSSDGMNLTTAPSVMLNQDTSAHPWETTIENPAMILVNGVYELFFSGGVWNSTGYAEGYAVCDGPSGPCSQPQVGSILNSYGTVAGPGGATLFADESGGWWIAYHGWTSGCTSYSCGGARELYTAPVVFGSSPNVPCAAPAVPKGYRLFAADGGAFDYGNLPFCGSTGALVLNQLIISGSPTGHGGGYWLVASDGGVFAFGDAVFYGSTGAVHLNRPMVGMAAHSSGPSVPAGYWLVASDGGVFAFGDAGFYGSTGAVHLNRPTVGMAATPSGRGYWLVASDGGVFAFGDAGFFGSTGALRLNRPIVAMAATPSGRGYWLVASDGGVFAFGDAGFFGSTGAIALNRPIVGMTATPTGKGYWLVASDGGVFAFGDAFFSGSAGGGPLNQPVVAVTGG